MTVSPSDSGLHYCAWCNGGRGEMKEIRLRIPQGVRLRRDWEELTVHERHENQVRRFSARFRRDAGRFAFAFFGLLVLSLACVVVIETGMASGATRALLDDFLTGGTLLGMGLIFFVFPFATPTTVEGIGVRTSIRLGRVVALIFSIVGGLVLLGNLL